jgi:hypothetical protein
MYKDEYQHLRAFLGFVKANNLVKHLQTKDWAKFAEGYNGAGFKENAYDKKMENAYNKYKALEKSDTSFSELEKKS